MNAVLDCYTSNRATHRVIGGANLGDLSSGQYGGSVSFAASGHTAGVPVGSVHKSVAFAQVFAGYARSTIARMQNVAVGLATVVQPEGETMRECVLPVFRVVNMDIPIFRHGLQSHKTAFAVGLRTGKQAVERCFTWILCAVVHGSSFGMSRHDFLTIPEGVA